MKERTIEGVELKEQWRDIVLLILLHNVFKFINISRYV